MRVIPFSAGLHHGVTAGPFVLRQFPENGLAQEQLQQLKLELCRGRPAGENVAVRDSRDPRGPALIYTRAEIAAFLAGAKAGEFDDLI